MWIHERLGWFVVLLVSASAIVVASRIAIARNRLRNLLALAEPLPKPVRGAFDRAASELHVPVPRIAYLDIPDRVAATVSGPVVLISRGFVAELHDEDLILVARHEVLHAQRRDAAAGVFWHLAFASLLLPGFEPLERRLHAARERRANLDAAHGREDQYVALLERTRSAMLCAGGQIGLEAAARQTPDRWFAWIAPAMVVVLGIALPLSHIDFLRNLPFLLRHHC